MSGIVQDAKVETPRIFVSTYAFPVKGLEAIVKLSLTAGIDNIELSSGAGYEPDLDAILARGQNQGLHFLVHNYFPAPPRDPFVLNLASAHPEIRARSIEHCRGAIDLSKRLGAAFYSVHAGFAFDVNPAELGRKLRPQALLPLDEAYRLFLDSVHRLTEYAAQQKIVLAIENHVLSTANASDGRNTLLLMVQAEDFLRLAEDIRSPHLRFLIDVGHLAVSARTLGFDPLEFLDVLGDQAIGVHLSDNDGLADQNLPFDSSAWFIPVLERLQQATMILECGPAPIEKIKSSCMAIEEGLRPCRQEWTR
jgi:sugar phosphate isomerase/epimerase